MTVEITVILVMSNIKIIENQSNSQITATLWDCLQVYSPELTDEEKETPPALLILKREHLGQLNTVVISPACIENDDGKVIEYYPSDNELIIEHCLKRIAIQNQNLIDEKDVKAISCVNFTMSQVKAELSKQGRILTYSEIILSLRILTRSIITITTEDQKNKDSITSAYFSRLSCLSNYDSDDSDALWFVAFHPLIAQDIV